MKPTSPTPSYNSDSTATDLDYSEYTLYQPNTPPTTRLASISPPPSRRRKISNAPNSSNIDAPVTLSHPSKRNLKFRDDEDNDIVKLADIEAVEVSIDDHVEYFSRRLSRVVNGRGALLGFGKWRELYERNLHERGRHFVVHQHDHPIAGKYAFSLSPFFGCIGTALLSSGLARHHLIAPSLEEDGMTRTKGNG